MRFYGILITKKTDIKLSGNMMLSFLKELKNSYENTELTGFLSYARNSYVLTLLRNKQLLSEINKIISIELY
jgi:hypothetical protein